VQVVMQKLLPFLFSRLLEGDDEKEIEKMLKITALDQRLPPILSPDDFNQLPEKPGIYYFYNALKKVIYVGKAINIKKRVTTHFSGHNINSLRQNFFTGHSFHFFLNLCHRTNGITLRMYGNQKALATIQ
jgi:DNA polymerase-3 subunit epsilon